MCYLKKGVFLLHICLGCKKVLKRHCLAVYCRTKQDICFFCHKIFDGNIKFIFSDPPFKCHSECLKVGYLFITNILHVSLFCSCFFPGQSPVNIIPCFDSSVVCALKTWEIC